MSEINVRKNSEDSKLGNGDGVDIRSDLKGLTTNEKSSLRVCNRSGCTNPAVEDPNWEGDFCSRDCALLRCREIFIQWLDSQKNLFCRAVKNTKGSY